MKKAPGVKSRIKYAAFLRGINVGGRTLLKMEGLKIAFESMGFRNVRTVLASGNVLFEAPEENTITLARTIAQQLAGSLGREAVVVCTLDELRELAAREPFKDIEAARRTRLFVTFLTNDVRLGASRLSGDDFRIVSASGRMVCSVLYERPGVGAVHLMGAIEKEFGHGVTTRTWDTITRLLKAGAP